MALIAPLPAFFFLVFFFPVEEELGVEPAAAVVDSVVVGGALGELKHLGNNLSTSTWDSVTDDSWGWEAKVVVVEAVAIEDILAAVDILFQDQWTDSFEWEKHIVVILTNFTICKHVSEKLVKWKKYNWTFLQWHDLMSFS